MISFCFRFDSRFLFLFKHLEKSGHLVSLLFGRALLPLLERAVLRRNLECFLDWNAFSCFGSSSLSRLACLSELSPRHNDAPDGVCIIENVRGSFLAKEAGELDLLLEHF